MKFEGNFMKLNTNEDNQQKITETGFGESVHGGLAEDSATRLEFDSTAPEGDQAREVILNFKHGIEKIMNPVPRFNAYLQLAKYAKSKGEKDLSRELIALAHEAEESFVAEIGNRDIESLDYITDLMDQYIDGGELSPRIHHGKTFEINTKKAPQSEVPQNQDTEIAA